jgi:hypothetical protein
MKGKKNLFMIISVDVRNGIIYSLFIVSLINKLGIKGNSVTK